ncbi:MerR family transcriptional regulator [Streptococcus vestibularis]|uniref:MerR family transcriptional regulator n=1 Tax=Streptococcus vestibularis TaxID=1343 RepID=UPI00232FE5A6|nr:MerR family transcriptional regulator [Streptococcus vestibularis]MDB6184040.1 MerR family transcriptional regulator [Streptococcus vestibularis]MDB6201672.1 MerR family transcriptional regulator [Streptococcus vestibularis]MDB6207192.1 MerR family transcriptional regulator [Streptococcus vestibularis]MDB6211322.1 MerR family transcriptional regulator [Streptococcus vestibularis]MDB6214841.1 MerR family transcriptional regulator [Streptococcus vestibularis]
MSQFSTGELAKAAEVSVRTVQYYDQRGILTPSEVTEGGRRIYHESDLERLQVICFLRDLDFSINQIKKLLQEENREQVLELLLTDQIESLEKSSKEIEVKLKRARYLQKVTVKRHQLLLEDLSDISRLMENQKSWRHLQLRMYGSVVLTSLLYLIGLLIVIYYFKDPRGLFIVCPAFLIGINLVVFHYRKQFEYLCPNCHRTFEPSSKEFALAGHTPRTRKLTCPHCHVKTYCLELAKSQTK